MLQPAQLLPHLRAVHPGGVRPGQLPASQASTGPHARAKWGGGEELVPPGLVRGGRVGSVSQGVEDQNPFLELYQRCRHAFFFFKKGGILFRIDGRGKDVVGAL